MNENKKLWASVFTTDPRAVKPITGKDYSGNSPKPYWIVERLTDTFGPCGIGWGFNVISERFERFGTDDTEQALHVARVLFWYMLDGKRGEFEQLGQTKASYTTSKGVFKVDEDAPKKSVTDALVKCASYLGFAGDIFSGRWDDSRYVQEAGREWDARREAEETHQANLDVLLRAGVRPDRCALVLAAAEACIVAHSAGNDWGAFEEYESLESNEEKLALWGILKPHPAVRRAIKQAGESARSAVAETPGESAQQQS